ncbi:MAG: esterase [Burkholderiales bacterium]|nr:esterase [Burkholderiales bacterium]
MFPSPSTPRPARRARTARGALKALTAAALAALAACGGGTSQYEPFVPERMFAFGDEASALTADAPSGRNYGINGINTNDTADDTSDDFLDCRLQPNWAQSLAASYGFVFAECNPGAIEVKARNWSAPGARVAEVAAQVDAQVAAGGFRDKDIASLMVGVNDIVEIYGGYDGSNEEALLAEARERGNRAAAVVNRLIALGAKVVLSNIPDLGYTPYAVKENAAHPDSNRAGVLSRLSAAFNERLGVSILIDGRFVALVQTDQRILAINRSPASFVIANAVDAACATPPPNCTNNTLVTDANATTWLWAGDLLLSSRGQSEVASLAITRAQRNPF